jgi:regulatory protein
LPSYVLIGAKDFAETQYSHSGETVAQTWRMKGSRRSTPLDDAALRRFALAYVGRYATTRAKLATYLNRKIAERGWSGDGSPPIDQVVTHCADAGYVDDAAFAQMRSNALTRRGFGNRRIGAALSAAGIARDVVHSVAQDEAAAFAAAETFAQRRRFGRFAVTTMDDAAIRRAFAAMLRAGHSFELARAFTQGSGHADAHDGDADLGSY